jgi:Flp pilus assembly protein TadG
MSTRDTLTHSRRRSNRTPRGNSRIVRTRWSAGQSATEMALVVPVLLLLLVAITDAGRMFYTYLEVVGASRAGAQQGAQTIVTAGCITPIHDAAVAAAPNLPGITATPTTYCCCASGSTCTPFGVTINSANTATYCGNSLTPFETSCGAKPGCSDWRKYVQVNTTATFTTLINYPGIQSSYTFNGQTIMRAQ